MAVNNEASGDDFLSVLRSWIGDMEPFKTIGNFEIKVLNDVNDKHYGSDLVFVDVTAQDNSTGEDIEYYIAIKFERTVPNVKETLSLGTTFEKEIDVYSKIFPIYYKLEVEKDLPMFPFAPKPCYTRFTNTEHVVIIKNLKDHKVHNRKIPMDLDHLKLVLEAYAEWHALSFAIQDQKNEEYLNIVNSWTYNNLEQYARSEQGKILDTQAQCLFDLLKEIGETELLQTYKEKIGNKGARQAFIDLYEKPEPQSVVLHGDCWNNNFLFKYVDGPFSKPLKACMIDFQLSSFRSPVFDLSYFIYANASETELKNFKELIDHYYQHLSNRLQVFGSDPEKVFSYSDLIRHLRKYLAYGAIMNVMALQLTLADKDKAPDFANDNVEPALKLAMHKEDFKSRAVAVARHFVQFDL